METKEIEQQKLEQDIRIICSELLSIKLPMEYVKASKMVQELVEKHGYDYRDFDGETPCVFLNFISKDNEAKPGKSDDYVVLSKYRQIMVGICTEESKEYDFSDETDPEVVRFEVRGFINGF